MGNLFLHMIIKNEATRYLDACLAHNMPLVDAAYVCDDDSCDGWREIAASRGCLLKSAEGITFSENEGLFRQYAWQDFQRTLKPTKDDWILCLDADELWVGTSPKKCIERTASRAIHTYIPEVFGFDEEGRPLIRNDGLWGGLYQTRLFQYRSEEFFSPSLRGCGAVPEQAQKRMADFCMDSSILHYGYACETDRMEKYQRYLPLVNIPGSSISGSHINSILGPSQLSPWTGDIPYVYRGTVKQQ